MELKKEENSFEKEVMELITNLKFEFCETYHISRHRYVECDKCADTEQKFGFKWIQLNQGWSKNRREVGCFIKIFHDENFADAASLVMQWFTQSLLQFVEGFATTKVELYLFPFEEKKSEEND